MLFALCRVVPNSLSLVGCRLRGHPPTTRETSQLLVSRDSATSRASKWACRSAVRGERGPREHAQLVSFARTDRDAATEDLDGEGGACALAGATHERQRDRYDFSMRPDWSDARFNWVAPRARACAEEDTCTDRPRDNFKSAAQNRAAIDERRGVPKRARLSRTGCRFPCRLARRPWLEIPRAPHAPAPTYPASSARTRG